MKSVLFASLFLSLLILSSCDECNDCDLKITEPRISVTFINADSLFTLTQLSDSLGLMLDSLQNESDTLESHRDFLSDSLINVEIGIDSGNVSLQPFKDQLVLAIKDDSVLIASISNEITGADSVLQMYSGIMDLINSGSVLVDHITNVHNDLSINFDDSISSYTIPLNIHDTLSWFEVSIADQSYDLQLTHSNTEFVDGRRNVSIEISGIEIFTHSFDSVAIDCNQENCKANETVITCSF